MKNRKQSPLHRVVSRVISLTVCVFLFSCTGVHAPDMRSCKVLDRFPSVTPDYVDVMVPPNIAPLNFIVEEPGDRFFVRISGNAGDGIEILSEKPGIKIPMKQWKRLLAANTGGSYQMDICVKQGNQWVRFKTVTNGIAREKLDPYLTYRKLSTMFYQPNPEMGIYQRNTGTFEERLILHRRQVRNDCINCHAAAANKTGTMLFHVRRQDTGPGMVIIHDGSVRMENHSLTPRGLISLTSIHPGGRVMAFAAVKMGFFSFVGGGSIDDRLQFEYAADLGLYDMETGEIRFIPGMSSPDYNETWPNWSGDGSFLCFSRCKVTWPAPKPGEEKVLPENYKDVKYDLMQASYDSSTRTFGGPEVLLSAQDVGKSCLQPSVSFSGRFVAFLLADYGIFPLLRPESDIYLMDMKTRTFKALACNSPQSESMVRWSSNDRWILFGSKRRDLVYTRLYFAYVDENGQSRRAVELPQEDPMNDETNLKIYTTASLLTEPVTYKRSDVIKAILAPKPDEPARSIPQKDTTGTPEEQQH